MRIEFQSIAPACLFLAAKVEEQPRKLEHVVGVAHRCLHRDAPAMATDTEVCVPCAASRFVIKQAGLANLAPPDLPVRTVP